MNAQYFKREFAAFLSYSSADAPLARSIRDWLSGFAGQKVWHDGKDINAGERPAEALERAVRSARSYLLLLTPNAAASRWVAFERSVAMQQAVEHASYKCIALVSADLPPSRIPSAVADLTQIRLPADGLDGGSAAKLLESLRADAGSAVTEDDVFVTRTWRATETMAARFADGVCAWLADRAGFRLIGDEPRSDEDIERQGNIIASCAAYLAIVPPRPADDLRYLVREIPLAQASGLPMVVVADPQVVALARAGELRTPDGEVVRLEGERLRLVTADMGTGLPCDEVLLTVAQVLDETARSRPTPRRRYDVVYAAEPRRLSDDVRRDIERVVRGITGRGCVFPEDIDGAGADLRTLQALDGAVATIADVSPGTPDAWVLAGAARASRCPVTLVWGSQDASTPPSESASPPLPRLFQHYTPRRYRNHLERLGLVHAAVYQHRRLFLNREVLR